MDPGDQGEVEARAGLDEWGRGMGEVLTGGALWRAAGVAAGREGDMPEREGQLWMEGGEWP